MTAAQRPSPDELAAFADGQLSRTKAERIEAALAADPSLRSEVEAHRALRSRLKARFDSVLAEPVPERLLALLEIDGSAQPAAQVIDLAAARSDRTARPVAHRWVQPAGWAIAATLVLGLVGLELRPRENYVSGDVSEALDNQLVANQAADAKIRVLLSFRDRAGAYCRGWSSTTGSGIACRDQRGWRIARAFPGTRTVDGEFRQAGASAPDLMTAMQAMADGSALDANGEAEAVRKGWR